MSTKYLYQVSLTIFEQIAFKEFLVDQIKKQNYLACQYLEEVGKLLEKIAAIHNKVINPNRQGLFGSVRVKAVPKLFNENVDNIKKLDELEMKIDKIKKTLELLVYFHNTMKQEGDENGKNTLKDFISVMQPPIIEAERLKKEGRDGFRTNFPDHYLSEEELKTIRHNNFYGRKTSSY
jgi:hypothetical protein